jgi:hypothetical protein
MTKDDYVTLRYSMQARRALVDLQVADEPVITEGGVQEILRRSREQVRDELLEELEDVRKQAAAERNAAIEQRQSEQEVPQRVCRRFVRSTEALRNDTSRRSPRVGGRWKP